MSKHPSHGEVLQDDGARKRLMDALVARGREGGAKVEFTDKTVGGFYDRKGDEGKPMVGVAKHLEHTDEGLSTLAHELGHAEFDKSLLGRVVQDSEARGVAGMAPLIGAIIALVAEGNVARRAALGSLGAMASQVPLLTGEGVAWAKGHKMMKEQGASPEQLKRLRQRAVSDGSTYLAPGANGVGAALLTAALKGWVG